MKLPSLNELLQYKNPLVIQRFQRNFPKYHDQAETLFTDLLKYLWLCVKYDNEKRLSPDDPTLNFNCFMHKEMIIIDEMWHTFILITKEYAAFCDHYFGEFIHHIPEVGDGNREIVRTDEEKALFENDLTLFLSYVYDHLGEETVRSWFGVYVNEARHNDIVGM